MTEDIKNDFLTKFPIPEGTSDKPYIILFDAYSGMGKSTVSLIIAEHLDVVILNNDEVRRYIDDIHDNTNLKDELQYMRLKLLYKHHNNCIWDCSFSHNYETKLKYIKDLGFKYYVIRLKCPEDVIKSRVSKRKLDGVNFSAAPFETYLRMKSTIPLVPDELVDFVIDTSLDIEDQVCDFIKYIKETQ